MGSISIKGVFHFIEPGEGRDRVDNEITDAGIDRIVGLMGGLSSEPWSHIRLILEDGTSVSKRASIERNGNGELISTATFLPSDLPASINEVEMLASDEVVARAETAVQGGRTIIVERHDYVRRRED